MIRFTFISPVLAATAVAVAGAALVWATAAEPQARGNSVSVRVSGGERCIVSNGLPPHATGRFPNRGNPHRIEPQRVDVCIDATPRDTGRITRRASASGITLAGVLIRPGTADWYDPRSPRGHSRDPSSGWRFDGIDGRNTFGMDRMNAHVDRRGTYHYHAPSDGLLAMRDGSHVGWAADGFEIHYVGAAARPSWQLKPGMRAGGPGGRHDGTFEQDWQLVPGSGNLDECNGGLLDGRYVYFATDAYPYFPRCFRGEVSADFRRRR